MQYCDLNNVAMVMRHNGIEAILTKRVALLTPGYKYGSDIDQIEVDFDFHAPIVALDGMIGYPTGLMTNLARFGGDQWVCWDEIVIWEKE